jgi:hypothetical protein
MNDLIEANDQRQLAVEERPVANDLRHAMMTLPVEHQNVMLAEYRERRDNFRRWLMQQLEEGKHYGIPPGCEPKQTNPSQWQAQPSLYAAGADLLCDLLGLRVEYSADLQTWQQFGSKPGHVVMLCRLFSRATGELVGEGRGARKEGQKGGDANNAVKMAQKSAKVDAVLNTYGLRDMFTQDLEHLPQPHDNPEADHEAPKAPTRGQRKAPPVSKEQCVDLLAYWRTKYPDSHNGDIKAWNEEFAFWVLGRTRRQFRALDYREWTPDDLHACCRALNYDMEASS